MAAPVVGEAAGEALACEPVAPAPLDENAAAVTNGDGSGDEDSPLRDGDDSGRPRKRGRPPQGGLNGPPLFNGFKCRVRGARRRGARARGARGSHRRFFRSAPVHLASSRSPSAFRARASAPARRARDATRLTRTRPAGGGLRRSGGPDCAAARAPARTLVPGPPEGACAG
jgi:hypothetical protein